jgi:hypothetical protein
LKDIKAADLKSRGLQASNDGNYYLWDHRFYNRLMVEQEFSIDEQKIAEYFPLQSTIEGMLGIFEELFGFVFVEIQPEDRIKLSGMYPLSPILLLSNVPQKMARMISRGILMSRSSVSGMMKTKAARLLVISISTCTPVKGSMATRPISRCSPVTYCPTEPAATPQLHLSAISLNQRLQSHPY